MLFNVIALTVGIMILCGGGYYYNQNKQDTESKKIYMAIAAIGAVITVVALLKLFV